MNILARIAYSSRIIFVIIPRIRDIHRKKILLAGISSTKRLLNKNKYIVMVRIAKKKTVDNNAGLLKFVDGINRKDVESVTDFGHFFIVILKDCAIFHTHIGFEARFKRWGGVDMEGHALTTTTFAWLENLVAMKKEVKGKENDIFPETDVTYQDMLDSMVIITDSNITHPLTAFLNADDAAKFAKEKLDYIGRMQKELENVMNTTVSEETEEDLKKNFEHGQKAILAEQAADALNQGKE